MRSSVYRAMLLLMSCRHGGYVDLRHHVKFLSTIELNGLVDVVFLRHMLVWNPWRVHHSSWNVEVCLILEIYL